MAAGLTQLRSEGRVHVRSAGSDPAEEINPAVAEAMAEVGLDLSEELPKPLTDDVVRAADVVITMGCGDACPVYPGKRYEEWAVDDPAGQDLAGVRRIRDEIDARVADLVRDLLGEYRSCRGHAAALARPDRSRRRDVERRRELGAVPLEHPRGALVAGHVPAQQQLEDLAVRAYETRVRQIREERHQVVERHVRLQFPVGRDREVATLCNRDDRLDAPRERARDDARDLVRGERPHELSRNHAARVVQSPEAIDLR